MLAIDRMKKIEDTINENGSIIISEISKELNVSEETIRRDLEKMEQKQLLKRVRGGAYRIEEKDDETSIEFRKKIYIDEKMKIANKAIKYINDGDIIFIGSSTTALYFAKKINSSNKKVTVISNSLEVISELEKSKLVNVICIGGILRKKNKSFIGSSAIKQLDNIYANKTFISCSGIDMKFGVTNSIEGEAEIKAKMIERSSECYLIIDNTKFDKIGTYSVCQLGQLKQIITDDKLTGEWEKKLKELNIEVNYA